MAQAFRIDARNAYDRLSTITCPCFVIAGANDDVFGAKASLEMAAELGCGCLVFPGLGHAVYDETPEFKTCLHTFLQSLQ